MQVPCYRREQEAIPHGPAKVGRRRQSRRVSDLPIDSVAIQFVYHARFRRFTFGSAAIPTTGRGSGILLDRQNLVFAGSVAGTVEPTHRRPIAFDKGGKRRANTPAAPEASRGVRPGRKPKTGPHKKTQKQGSVLTFGVLSKICRSRKQLAIFEQAAPANRERPRRSFVLLVAREAQAQRPRARCQARSRRSGGSRRAAAALQRGSGHQKTAVEPNLDVARPKLSGLQSGQGGGFERRRP